MVAAYGSAVTSDWRTTGICFDVVSRELTICPLLSHTNQMMRKSINMISHAQILSLAAEMDPFSVGAWVGGMSEPIDNLKPVSIVRRSRFRLIPTLSIFQELAVGTLVNVKHQSGGSSDCIESTGWPYNKFTVHNTANN